MPDVPENDAASPSPVTPSLEPLFTLTCDVGPPLELGSGPTGRRRIVPITGGVFEGPTMRGTVLPGGSDWQVLRFDHVTELQAQYVLRTEDDVLIQVSVRGLRHGPKEVMARVASGEAVAPTEYYFRTSPVFAAPDGPYAWLNRSIFISLGERYHAAVRLHFYRVA